MCGIVLVCHALLRADTPKLYGQPPAPLPEPAMIDRPPGSTAAPRSDNGLDGIDGGPLTPLHDFWDDVTDRLDRASGLDLGFDYTAVYQRASEADGPKDAGGGDFDFFGTWHLLGTEDQWPGNLAFSTETRHRYSAIPPAELGPLASGRRPHLVWPALRRRVEVPRLNRDSA